MTYTDGRVDRWIEIPTAGGQTPEHPAALDTHAPAVAPASAAPAAAPPSAGPTASPAASGPLASASPSGTGRSWALPVVLGAVLLAALALGGVLLARVRRRST